MVINKEQCKAARLFLGWNQLKAAERTGVASSTINRFEAGKGEMNVENLTKILDTFENEGIEFVDNKEKFGILILKNR